MLVTEDVMTSTVTPHTATRCPDGWAVSWLGDRTVDRNGAIIAMMVAELITSDKVADLGPGARVSIEFLADELGLTDIDAIRMVVESLPAEAER